MPLGDFRPRRRHVIVKPADQLDAVGIDEACQAGGDHEHQQVAGNHQAVWVRRANRLEDAPRNHRQKNGESGCETAVRIGPDDHQRKHQPETPKLGRRQCQGAVLGVALGAPSEWPESGPAGKAPVAPGDECREESEGEHVRPKAPVVRKVPGRNRADACNHWC